MLQKSFLRVVCKANISVSVLKLEHVYLPRVLVANFFHVTADFVQPSASLCKKVRAVIALGKFRPRFIVPC